MTSSSDPPAERAHGFLSPPGDAEPHDSCFRCGKRTAAGNGLCDEHNPGRVRGPSSTQMHATILLGVLAGFIGFFLVAGLAVGNTGPYTVAMIAAADDPSGGVAMAYSIVNEGDSDGVADCRVTRDGVPRPDDLAFRSPSLDPGEVVLFERIVPQPVDGVVRYDPERATVVCS